MIRNTITNSSALFILFIVSILAMSALNSSHAFPLQKGRIISASNLSLSYVQSAKTGQNYYDTPIQVDSAPTTLFIHGLDSSSQTWQGVQASLKSPSIAVDCRGCGHSELGDPSSFSAEALVQDVKSLVESHEFLKNRPFVLVGHSMGGRIAMQYAAAHPEDVAALVVEDMDIRRRGLESNMIENFDYEKAISFEREHDSLESLKNAFEEIGYPLKMLDKWIAEGRVEKKSESYWSGVNPAFRALCYKTIFDSDCGVASWTKIAKYLNDDSNNKHFQVHLMVAGVGTVCDDENVRQMQQIMQNIQEGKPVMSTKLYEQGTHSIHNSMRDEFVNDLEEIIRVANE
ncbi:hypothetical protein ACHAXS_013600 [Conticribra weissflogii]